MTTYGTAQEKNVKCNSQYSVGHRAAELLMDSNKSNVKKVENMES